MMKLLLAAIPLCTAVFGCSARDNVVTNPAPQRAAVRGDRLYVVDPRFSLAIPAAWIKADSGRLHTLHVDAPGLATVREALGEWDREFAAIASATLPFGSLVAHLGEEPFGEHSGLYRDLHVRAYVVGFPPESLHHRVAGPGRDIARTFFPNVTVAADETRGEWRIARLTYPARYYDYGATAIMEFYGRPVQRRTVVLLFMYTSFNSYQVAERDRILRSFREEAR